MADRSIPSDRQSAGLALVQQHGRLENKHHLENALRVLQLAVQLRRGGRTMVQDGVKIEQNVFIRNS